jgi:hypothetical protein
MRNASGLGCVSYRKLTTATRSPQPGQARQMSTVMRNHQEGQAMVVICGVVSVAKHSRTGFVTPTTSFLRHGGDKVDRAVVEARGMSPNAAASYRRPQSPQSVPIDLRSHQSYAHGSGHRRRISFQFFAPSSFLVQSMRRFWRRICKETLCYHGEGCVKSGLRSTSVYCGIARLVTAFHRQNAYKRPP